ncbi:hypothetical protein BD408DRAFT_436236 [Parasitella parasitica]|nr:hypothetical protein BD408DRAFT_436236 [Parasitella parasitica]
MNNDYFQRQLNKETTSDYITENVGSLLKIEKEARIALVLVSKSLYKIAFESTYQTLPVLIDTDRVVPELEYDKATVHYGVLDVLGEHKCAQMGTFLGSWEH